MTTQKLFKRRVRERMAKTGERYSAARLRLMGRKDLGGTADPGRADPPDLASAMEIASDAKLHEATGKHWLEWIAILDAWGARDHTHPEIVEYLSREHSVAPWWRQAVTNGYERASGMRKKHQQADGFTVYASKTFGVPLDVLFDAFVDDGIRVRWLTDGTMSLRNAQPGKVARFDWAGDATRVEVTFEAKGTDRATAHVAHARLADATVANGAKGLWKERLATLARSLEARSMEARS